MGCMTVAFMAAILAFFTLYSLQGTPHRVNLSHNTRSNVGSIGLGRLFPSRIKSKLSGSDRIRCSLALNLTGASGHMCCSQYLLKSPKANMLVLYGPVLWPMRKWNSLSSAICGSRMIIRSSIRCNPSARFLNWNLLL